MDASPTCSSHADEALPADDGVPPQQQLFATLRAGFGSELGVVTACVHSPSAALREDDETEVRHEDIVRFEVMTDELDRPCRHRDRHELQRRFDLREIVVRAAAFTRFQPWADSPPLHVAFAVARFE